MSTQRLDAAQAQPEHPAKLPADNNQGTQRLDAQPDDIQGTQRLDDGQGTQRLDSDLTQRLDDNSSIAAGDGVMQIQSSAQEAVADGKKTGEFFSAGQVIDLNGNNYQIENLISQNSGEGIIYTVSEKGKNYIFKHYRLGNKYPVDVLTTLKNNPQSRIIKLFEFGSRNGQDYEIMEYAEGGTLDSYLKENGPIRDVSKLRVIVEQINEGLYQLHNKLRIIYQDLKPENIYFKDREKSQIVLADFGISNIMLPGKNEAQVKANVTKEYAAPELARTGNEVYVEVGPPVDYFALGITIYHIWLGHKPFQDMSQGTRDNYVRENAVPLPADMSNEYKTLIQGLIHATRNSRWGYNQITKWVAGESVQSDYQQITFNYERAMFNETESYGSLEELAALLEKYPDLGEKRLYGASIIGWLTKSGNPIVDDIQQIVTTHQNNKKSGLYKTIYTLDPERPFTSDGGKKCSSTVEIADALVSESGHYKTALKKKDAWLYQYLETAHGVAGKNFADQFNKYFNDFSGQHALNLCYLKLQEDGGRCITLGSKTYQNAEEIGAETAQSQKDKVEKAVTEKDSLFNVWLSDQYGDFYESTEGFFNINASDKFFLLGKLPFLSYKKFHENDWQERALTDLTDLIHNNSGRHDLFDIYAAEDLPFRGQSQKLSWKPTPVQYLVRFFDSIVPDQAAGFALLRFLINKGADINEPSGDGSLPLTTAIENRNIQLAKLLLDLGSDPNKEYKYAPIMWALYKKDDKDGESDRIALANLLIDYKANLNINTNHVTPLVCAINFFDSPEKIDLISRMLESGADPNLADDDAGISPLANAVAIQFQHRTKNNQRGEDLAYKAAELLLKNGAKTKNLNKKGYWSPLMRAADGGLVDTIKLLLRYGADKELTDVDGDTPFLYAKKSNQNRAAELLKPGADFNIKAALLQITKIAFCVFSALWIFLTFDALSRGISLFNPDFIALIAAAVLVPHILTALAGISLCGGFGEYFGRIFNKDSVEFAFCYIIFIPILFPLAIAGLQALTGFLPDGLRIALLSPANVLSSSGSPVTMIILFFSPLVIITAGAIVFDKVTATFARKVRFYKQWS